MVLCAHNGESLDIRVLLLAAAASGKSQNLKAVVRGFADTLPIFKKEIPGKKSYSQGKLFEELVGGKYQAHDALKDVTALQAQVAKTQLSTKLASSAVTFTSAQCVIDHRCLVHQLTRDLTRIPSLSCPAKLAGTGLSYHHLQVVYTWQSDEGLRAVLSEKVNGKARVTKCKKILDAIVEHFSSKAAQEGKAES